VLGTEAAGSRTTRRALHEYTIKKRLPTTSSSPSERPKSGGRVDRTDGGGVCISKDGKFPTYDSERPPSDTIWSIHEDTTGALWIGMFPQGSFASRRSGPFFGEKDGLPPKP